MIRHAKSSWGDLSLSDVERPLNQRGKDDAPFMAQILSERYPSIDLLVSSHAKRARHTAKFFAKAYFKKKSDIVINPNLYHCDEDEIQEIIQKLPSNVNRVALFGHNPGWTFFVNEISAVSIDNIPTCGIAFIQSQAEQWNRFDITTSVLKEFYYPKQFNR